MSEPGNAVDRDPAGPGSPGEPARRSSRRFTVRPWKPMAFALYVGLLVGFVAWRTDRHRREKALVAKLEYQHEVTLVVLNVLDPIVRRQAGDQPVHWGSERRRGDRGDWLATKEAWLDEQGRRRDLLNLQVTGGAHDLAVRPILIEDRGGELNARFIGLLRGAFRARQWTYRVVQAHPGEGG
jgi:hypothetical protein